jgi:hypothetical protein
LSRSSTSSGGNCADIVVKPRMSANRNAKRPVPALGLGVESPVEDRGEHARAHVAAEQRLEARALDAQLPRVDRRARGGRGQRDARHRAERQLDAEAQQERAEARTRRSPRR